jgi:hypothetical protein
VRSTIDFKIIRLARVRFEFETPALEEITSLYYDFRKVDFPMRVVSVSRKLTPIKGQHGDQNYLGE